MKHKTWFRLVLKAIGILLIAWGIGGAIDYIGEAVSNYRLQVRFGGAITPGWITEYLAWRLAGPVVETAIGFYLVFGGKALLNWIIPSNHPYCPECGYNLSATHPDTARCVECGVTLPNEWASSTSNEHES